MTPQALITLGSNVSSAIGNQVPNPWGTTPAQFTALMTGDTNLTNAINHQKAAEIAARAATVAKNAKKATLVAALTSVQTTVAANPAVTDEMLVSLGFSPRRGRSRSQPATPTAVTGLTAAPSASGTVKLAWKRGGNAKSTMFVVETSADGTSWTMIKSTTRVSYAAEGFAPGVAAWFRVTATTSVLASQPSLPVTIYVTAAPASLSREELKALNKAA